MAERTWDWKKQKIVEIFSYISQIVQYDWSGWFVLLHWNRQSQPVLCNNIINISKLYNAACE